MSSPVEGEVLEQLAGIIVNATRGLDPAILATWYRVIEAEARASCSPHLADTIRVIQDPLLPLKFEFRASRRALPWVFAAIANHLGEMPFATRLYFQKLEELLHQAAGGSGAQPAS